MPGTLMLDAYSMSTEDACAILLARRFSDDLAPLEADELHRAARSVVEAHAAEVARRYVPRPDPVTSAQGILKVVRGGKDE